MMGPSRVIVPRFFTTYEDISTRQSYIVVHQLINHLDEPLSETEQIAD